MKLYLVMKAVSSMDIAGQSCNLPDGEYAIPAFADFKKAEEHANNGKFNIYVVEAVEDVLIAAEEITKKRSLI